MKTGQPSKKAAAAKPAGKATAKPAAGGPKAPAKPAAAPGRAAPPMGLDDDDDDFRPPPSAEDDPFELEKKAASAVIALRAAPAKGLGLKVVCPMCETVGYTTTKAAGQSVKCANPKCLVPLFTAPAPKVEAPHPPPPPPPRSKVPLVFGLFFGLIVAGAAGAWYAGVFDTGSGPPKSTKVDLTEFVTPEIVEPEVQTPDPKKTGANVPDATPDAKASDHRKEAYDQLIEVSRDLNDERGKALTRSMAAEISALRGDVPEARSQIEQLLRRARNVDYFAIRPLTEIGWIELAAGRADGAAAVAKELEPVAKQLPPFGRDMAEFAPQLAAYYCAVGKFAEAEAVINTLNDQAAVGAVTVPLVTSLADRTYDFEAAVENGPLLPWTAPHRVAVTRILLARGAWDPALEWAKRIADIEGKTECLVEWGKAAVKVPAGASSPVEKLQGVITGMPPAAKARVFASMGLAHAEELRSEPAETMLKSAREALAAVAVPESPPIPSAKDLSGYAPTDAAPLRQAAHAAAIIALAEGMLKQPEKAIATLNTALAYARGIGPSLPAVNAKMQAAENDPEGTQATLRAELKLKTADESRLAFNNYRRQMTKVSEAAKRRFEIQSTLLASLGATPVRDTAWAAVQAGDARDGDEREPFLDGAAPWEIAAGYAKAGFPEKAQSVKQVLETQQKTADTEQLLTTQLDELVSAGQAAAVGGALDASMTDRAWKERWLQETAARLTKSGRFEVAVVMLRNVKDPVLRDSSLSATSALAARTGSADAVWTASQQKGVPLSDKAAFLRGYLVGPLATEKK